MISWLGPNLTSHNTCTCIFITGTFTFIAHQKKKRGRKKKEKGKRKNHKYINTQPETNTHKIKEIILKNSFYGLGKYKKSQPLWLRKILELLHMYMYIYYMYSVHVVNER